LTSYLDVILTGAGRGQFYSRWYVWQVACGVWHVWSCRANTDRPLSSHSVQFSSVLQQRRRSGSEL